MDAAFMNFYSGVADLSGSLFTWTFTLAGLELKCLPGCGNILELRVYSRKQKEEKKGDFSEKKQMSNTGFG